MPATNKDLVRAELVKIMVKSTQGRIFTVQAKRKKPKVTYIPIDQIGIEMPLSPTEAKFKKMTPEQQALYRVEREEFMTLTCRTGVKKDLKGGKSTIRHDDSLISVNLTNDKGYRCFSAFHVLSLKFDGNEMKFNEAKVLAYKED